MPEVFSTSLRALMVIVAALLLSVMPHVAHAQVQTTYSNTITGTINDVDCGTAGQVSRTFTVPTSYSIGDVNIGVLISHTYRSDLRITLTSPAGTTVQVMTWTGNVQSGDNFNDLFDDEAAAALSTHNTTVTDPLTPTPPPYSHSFQPSSPLSAFRGQNAQGTWTLVVCDAVATDVGTFTRADLFITSTSLSVVKTSSVVSDPTNGTTNPKAIPGAIIRYCVLVTNNGGATQTAVTMTDPVPSTMTVLAGTLRSGTSCAGAATVEDDDASDTGEADPVTMAIAGSTVSGAVASLAAGVSYAMVFNARVN